MEALSVKDIGDLYRAYVTPRGAVLALSGDIDEKEVFSYLEELFGGWEGPKTGLARVGAGRVGKEIAVEKEIQQTHMVFGFVGRG